MLGYNNLTTPRSFFVLFEECSSELYLEIVSPQSIRSIFPIGNRTAKSGQNERPIPEQTEHMIPEMTEHLKPKRKHHNISAKRLYNLITNRLLTLNRNRVLTNTGICNLNKKLESWEHFCNFNCPQGALNGQTPYEVLRCILK